MSAYLAASLFTLLVLSPEPTTQNSDPQEQTASRGIRKSGSILRQGALKKVEPVYPPQAKAEQVSGSVLVEVTIDQGGSVTAAKALSGHPMLRDSAVAAAWQWSFSPTTLSGKPVKVIGTLTFKFVLTDKAPTAQHLAELKKEVLANPDSAEAHYNLGRRYSSSGREEEAISELQEAICLNYDFVKAYISLGDALRRLGRTKEAVGSYCQAFRLEPGNVDIALTLKGVYRQLGRINDALDVLQQAAEANPQDSSLHIELAWVLSDVGRYEEAVATYEKAVSLLPADTSFSDTGRLHWWLGRTYSRAGRYNEAVQSFEKALTLLRPYDFIYLELGLTYLRLGDKESATRIYKALKRVDAAYAKELLQQIQQ